MRQKKQEWKLYTAEHCKRNKKGCGSKLLYLVTNKCSAFRDEIP